MINTSNWSRCAICGKPVHPMQESSAAPLADGIACVSCAYGRVWPTIRNKGVPSHFTTERNREGRYESKIVADRN